MSQEPDAVALLTDQFPDGHPAADELIGLRSACRTLACGCVLGHERCFDCRPGLHLDQKTALAMSIKCHSIDHTDACRMAGKARAALEPKP